MVCSNTIKKIIGKLLKCDPDNVMVRVANTSYTDIRYACGEADVSHEDDHCPNTVLWHIKFNTLRVNAVNEDGFSTTIYPILPEVINLFISEE